MKKTIIYTESGKTKLDSVLLLIKQKIEKEIKDSKNFPGEESIEITASDIEKVYNRIRFYKPTHPINRSVKLILPIYFVLGLITMFYGLFYENIKQLSEQNPIQLIFILAGFMLSLLSGVLILIYRQKEGERRRDQVMRKFED